MGASGTLDDLPFGTQHGMEEQYSGRRRAGIAHRVVYSVLRASGRGVLWRSHREFVVFTIYSLFLGLSRKTQTSRWEISMFACAWKALTSHRLNAIWSQYLSSSVYS
jgi:hypothetical protein